ncbi:MAG: SMC-Scp complex subunit ScpB, partial [Gammaproteobacteria bacterium]|nr:SMC-Scp complex subunit ScpB [Gammaproteobacteria bacterium]
MKNKHENILQILEAALFAAGEPLNLERLALMFDESDRPSNKELRDAIASLTKFYEDRGVELVEVASGFRFQSRVDYAPWLKKLWEKKPPRYSRALLETIALVVYRQPITRGEIEDVRGVVVSSNIMKTLLEREWVKIVGHKDVPGKPALYATTKQFLDYFNLKS